MTKDELRSLVRETNSLGDSLGSGIKSAMLVAIDDATDSPESIDQLLPIFADLLDVVAEVHEQLADVQEEHAECMETLAKRCKRLSEVPEDEEVKEEVRAMIDGTDGQLEHLSTRAAALTASSRQSVSDAAGQLTAEQVERATDAVVQHIEREFARLQKDYLELRNDLADALRRGARVSLVERVRRLWRVVRGPR